MLKGVFQFLPDSLASPEFWLLLGATLSAIGAAIVGIATVAAMKDQNRQSSRIEQATEALAKGSSEVADLT